ncbi:MAG: cytidylate kinase-like family protein [Elusimicrobiota bacterium]
MAEPGGVTHYIHGLAAEARPGGTGGTSGLPFVTVSRQAGAGGHAFAETLLKRMERSGEDPLLRGWRMFDQQLCEKVANDPALKVSMKSLLSEEFHGSIEDCLSQLLAATSPQAAVYHKIFETICTVAALGKAVIVGRAGVCLTRRYPGGIHIRLIGSKGVRIENMARSMDVSPAEAERHIDKLDGSRAKLVRAYFQRDIHDPLLYDAVWNTDAVPLERIAAAVIEMIRRPKG